MKPSVLVAIALCSQFGRLASRNTGATIGTRPEAGEVIVGLSPSSIIVDELSNANAPRLAPSLYGNPRPYLKRKKGRS